MKQNLFIFANSILRKQNNTLCIESLPQKNSYNDVDVDNSEGIMLLNPDSENQGISKKYIPTENVEAIYTFGCIKFNTHFINMASYHNIPVHIFNFYGGYSGSFLPKPEIASGNIILKQSEAFLDNSKKLAIAKKIIDSAAHNSIANLKYYLYRDVPLNDEISRIKDLKLQISLSNSTGELMGIEGNIKAIYYSCWKKIFKSDIDFSKRVKRPPDNMINCLISFGNVMLYSICLNEIYRTGLIPSIGFLHSPGDNRNSLSFDIAEIFKPLIVDKVIFRSINLDILKENDFIQKNNSMIMKDNAKKSFVENIENRLKSTFLYEPLKRHITYKTLIRLNCYSLINHLKSGEEFKPYLAE